MKSSNDGGGPARSEEDEMVAVATGLRLRGARGHLTALLVPGGIDQLREGSEVLVGRRGGASARYAVEEHRIYREKMILKFRGIDTA
ncbi:MAG TPA: hypothetical protein VFT43_05585 [Candidatus Polarisedimenticolia bacterium]|nr:hypothetical protein [Candidatus Polarisedimenticolia bacterium]